MIMIKTFTPAFVQRTCINLGRLCWKPLAPAKYRRQNRAPAATYVDIPPNTVILKPTEVSEFKLSDNAFESTSRKVYHTSLLPLPFCTLKVSLEKTIAKRSPIWWFSSSNTLILDSSWLMSNPTERGVFAGVSNLHQRSDFTESWASQCLWSQRSFGHTDFRLLRYFFFKSSPNFYEYGDFRARTRLRKLIWGAIRAILIAMELWKLF